MCGSDSTAKANYALAVQSQRFQEEQVKKVEQRELERQKNIQTGLASIDQQFSKFDPSFYGQIESAYSDYTAPQLAQAEKATRDQVKFGLARSGLSQSSSAAKQYGDLSENFGQARVDAAARGLELVNQRKDQIEANRAAITNQLYASENPEIALQSSQRAVAGLSSPSIMTPITDIIASASQFAKQDWMNNNYGYYNGRGVTGNYFNSGGGQSGSGKVVK